MISGSVKNHDSVLVSPSPKYYLLFSTSIKLTNLKRVDSSPPDGFVVIFTSYPSFISHTSIETLSISYLEFDHHLNFFLSGLLQLTPSYSGGLHPVFWKLQTSTKNKLFSLKYIFFPLAKSKVFEIPYYLQFRFWNTWDGYQTVIWPDFSLLFQHQRNFLVTYIIQFSKWDSLLLLEHDSVSPHHLHLVLPQSITFLLCLDAKIY